MLVFGLNLSYAQNYPNRAIKLVLHRFLSSASIRAILHALPVLGPRFAPGHGATTNRTEFAR